MPDRIQITSWVLALPFLIFGLGVGLYSETENQVRAQFDRAHQYWRVGQYEAAVALYESVCRDDPKGTYAARALWELGSISYLNWYDIDKALDYFNRLVTDYPGSLLAARGYMMLGEIHELALQDLPRAIECWQRLLGSDPEDEMRQQALYRLGNTLFKLEKLSAARVSFERLIAERPEASLTQEANLRVGTILQLQEDYQESLVYFRAVLDQEACGECRLQAQLGLIESYEFLGDLGRAIAIAEDISTEQYSPEAKSLLLARLSEKQRVYEPRSWKTGRD